MDQLGSSCLFYLLREVASFCFVANAGSILCRPTATCLALWAGVVHFIPGLFCCYWWRTLCQLPQVSSLSNPRKKIASSFLKYQNRTAKYSCSCQQNSPLRSPRSKSNSSLLRHCLCARTHGRYSTPGHFETNFSRFMYYCLGRDVSDFKSCVRAISHFYCQWFFAIDFICRSFVNRIKICLGLRTIFHLVNYTTKFASYSVGGNVTAKLLAVVLSFRAIFLRLLIYLAFFVTLAVIFLSLWEEKGIFLPMTSSNG